MDSYFSIEGSLMFYLFLFIFIYLLFYFSTEGKLLSERQEKCYDTRDSTLKFVDGEDNLDFNYEDFKSPKAAMSCGHAVTPMSLTKYCRWLLDEGKHQFVCPCDDCGVEWSYGEVRKMALLTTEEMEYFENKMACKAKEYFETKSCPGCNSTAERTDLNDLSVCCTLCSSSRGKTYTFCWQCLKEWKGPAPRSDHCENDGCTNEALQILKTCPELTFQKVTGITGCPSVRACPTCGILIEHDTTKCKNIICQRCKVEFCFVCLKLTKECLNESKGSYFKPCSSRVAPRQTSIPKWNR